MFKASNLDQFAVGPNYSLLDADTLKQIVESRSIRKKLKEGKIKQEDIDPNIAQVNQRVILVVTNEFGQTSRVYRRPARQPVFGRSIGEIV